jgi:hypothetical protein
MVSELIHACPVWRVVNQQATQTNQRQRGQISNAIPLENFCSAQPFHPRRHFAPSHRSTRDLEQQQLTASPPTDGCMFQCKLLSFLTEAVQISLKYVLNRVHIDGLHIHLLPKKRIKHFNSIHCIYFAITTYSSKSSFLTVQTGAYHPLVTPCIIAFQYKNREYINAVWGPKKKLGTYTIPWTFHPHHQNTNT